MHEDRQRILTCAAPFLYQTSMTICSDIHFTKMKEGEQRKGCLRSSFHSKMYHAPISQTGRDGSFLVYACHMTINWPDRRRRGTKLRRSWFHIGPACN